jgi:hypothetical protein
VVLVGAAYMARTKRRPAAATGTRASAGEDSLYEVSGAESHA